jgi:hypothetical protein
MKPSRSTTIAILIMFAGYTIGTYGIVLLRDYNITWKQWINPLNPWIWSNPVPRIPAGKLWPSPGPAIPKVGLLQPGLDQQVANAADNAFG